MPQAIERDTLLDAALEAFSKYGYAGATTKRIAAMAEVSEVTLFRRFGSKDKLVLAALRRKAEGLAQVDASPSGDMRTDLLQIIGAYNALLASNASMLLTYFSEVTRKPDLTQVLQFPLEITGRFADLLRHYQETGQLAEEDPYQQLACLFGPLLSTHMFQAVGAPAPPFDVERHVDAFLAGRAPHS